MLIVANRLREITFGKLMDIYQEGNLENGRERWPNETAERQLALAEEDFRQYLRECFFPTPGAVYFVWQENGQYVSALRLEPYQDGLLLEALETRPTMRRKGFAAKLIKEMLLTLPKGTIVYSHVSKRNFASLKTHEVCGFEKMLDYAVYADGSVLRNSCTLRIRL